MADFARALQSQNIWFHAAQYRDAEIKLAQRTLGITPAAAAPAAAPASPVENKASTMVSDLQKQLKSVSTGAVDDVSKMLERVLHLEKENESIKKSLLQALERLDLLEKGASVPAPAAAKVEAAPTPAKKEESEDDDDDDFFGSDSDEDEEAAAAAEELKKKRVAEYEARKAAKNAKKPAVVAKSSITFDVKPWDDTTNLDELAEKVRAIEQDGLLWGKHQKKPLAYGIFKLVIVCVVEDDKVSSDDLIEQIEGFEDLVQSVDVAAFNKI